MMYQVKVAHNSMPHLSLYYTMDIFRPNMWFCTVHMIKYFQLFELCFQLLMLHVNILFFLLWGFQNYEYQIYKKQKCFL